jgi:hypothetical protein
VPRTRLRLIPIAAVAALSLAVGYSPRSGGAFTDQGRVGPGPRVGRMGEDVHRLRVNRCGHPTHQTAHTRLSG